MLNERKNKTPPTWYSLSAAICSCADARLARVVSLNGWPLASLNMTNNEYSSNATSPG